MKLTIKEFPELKIAYFRNIGEYGGERNRKMMETFKKWVKMNRLFEESVILGIPHDNPNLTPKEQCRYDIGVVVPEGFMITKPAKLGFLSGGKYAVFLVDHTKEAVSDFWSNIQTEIKRNDLEVREQPIIEQYTSKMIDNQLCEILVPIR